MIASFLTSQCSWPARGSAVAGVWLASVVSKTPANINLQPGAHLPQCCQQVRTVIKTKRIDSSYGRKPLFTDHMYQAAMDEQAEPNELAYQEIRFATLWETNSPLQDDVVENYLRLITYDGRRWLSYQLLHNTFYEIKLTQYKRYLKRKQALEKAEAAAADGSKGGGEKKVAKSAIAEGDEESEEIELNPVTLFHKAVENCKPLVVTKKVRRGGATYQVPFPLRASDSNYLGMKWLNSMIKERPKPREKHYHEELAWEIIEAAQGRGKVVKKRDDMHKLAQANKAYAHYRWG